LGVFGLSSTTTREDLRQEFGRFGDLDKVDLIIDKRVRLAFPDKGILWLNYFSRLDDQDALALFILLTSMMLSKQEMNVMEW
jgi:hypothetical protein